MRRTEVLQGIRLMRFEEIYERFRRGRLSGLEAAEWLGISERTFRRLRGPNAARFLVGGQHNRLIPASAVMGAVFLVFADIGTRILIPGQVLPIGVVTALIGAPAFAPILVRGQR